MRWYGKDRRSHFIYWLYGANGQVLYIGCTNQPEGRWRHHCRQSHWVNEVIRCHQFGPLHEGQARRLEREAIRAEQPPYNVMHTPRWHLWREPLPNPLERSPTH